jgi:hypothetical protein
MSICNRSTTRRQSMRTADKRDASSDRQAGPGDDLANTVRDCAVTGTDPFMTGFCACALAFSTLLSSQGADAHHPRLWTSSGATLLTYRASQRLSSQLAESDVPVYSLYIQHTRTRTPRCWERSHWEGDLPGRRSRPPRGEPLLQARRNSRQQKGSSQIGPAHCGAGSARRGSRRPRAHPADLP